MRAALCILIALLFAGSCRADDSVAAVRPDTLVSLITAFPGTDIYELEGHSAIRINMGAGRDYAVSYGIFNFNAPNFVYRFVKGETDYMVGAVPFAALVDDYRRHGRRVEELPVNLTPEQKAKLLDLLTENLKPENRVYRYNYVKDNCSTRPLAMLEAAVAPDTLDLGSFDRGDDRTFRDVMRRYHRNYPWYQFGIDLALGAGIDYPITDREFSFVPMLMAQQAASAKVGGKPFAGQASAAVDLPPDNAVDGPTPWWLSPLFVCWIVFALVAAVAVYDLVRHRITRWVDAVYFGALGLAGLLLTFLIFISVHEATSPNYLYIWLNPLCLIPAVFIWFKKGQSVVWWYYALNFTVVAVGLAAWPLMPQSGNAAFLPLVLADLILSARFLAKGR